MCIINAGWGKKGEQVVNEAMSEMTLSEGPNGAVIELRERALCPARHAAPAAVHSRRSQLPLYTHHIGLIVLYTV